jgi:hypothetical protein
LPKVAHVEPHIWVNPKNSNHIVSGRHPPGFDPLRSSTETGGKFTNEINRMSSEF